MQGKTSDQIRKLEKDLGLEENDLIKFRKIDAAGGESHDEIRARIKSIFDEQILRVSEKDKRYLVICHGGTVLSSEHLVLDLMYPEKNMKYQEFPVQRVPNASLT